uniref:Reverse transcriptase domain-containing protein n=1 Tax=Tanacetum cinerariifolium TaxID=118510 RepID=A0A699ILN2_TANCI|nr:hypothetical protein [Tanacetum cinerariifolium]
MGRSCTKNNNTHKSMQPRPVIHRVNRFPIVDLKFSTAVRRVKTAVPRPNMNSTRPQTTQDLMIILIQRVQRLEKELKARTPIYKVDRGRSRPVMAWVPKKKLNIKFKGGLLGSKSIEFKKFDCRCSIKFMGGLLGIKCSKSFTLLVRFPTASYEDPTANYFATISAKEFPLLVHFPIASEEVFPLLS